MPCTVLAADPVSDKRSLAPTSVVFVSLFVQGSMEWVEFDDRISIDLRGEDRHALIIPKY